MDDQAKGPYLSALINSTEDYIWSVDLDFRIVAFNRATGQPFERLLGRPLSPGVRHDEQLPPELGAKWVALYQRAISEGPFQTEHTFANGRIRDLSFNPIVVDGAIIGVSVFGKDVTARKAEEKARLEAEGKFREIFNGALEGIFQTSYVGQPLAANPALASMLGYDSPAEYIAAVGNTALNVWVNPEQRAKYFQLLEETGVVRRFETQFKRKDGTPIWVSFNTRKALAADGKTLVNEGFIEDITARKAEEKARLEAEWKYREIFNGALEGIFQTTYEGQPVTANPALASMLGYDSPEEFTDAIGNTALDVWVDPEQRTKYIQLLDANEVVRRFETQFKRKDGTSIWVSLNTRKALAADGKTLLNEGFIEDITERKLAELRILERDSKLREAEELAHLGHSSWDPETNITTWSEELYKITGWDRNQPPPGHSERAKLYTPESWKLLEAAVKHSLATGDPYDLELQIVRRDGVLRWVRARGFASRDPSGKVTRLFGTLQDITEQKLSEMNLRDSEERFRATFEQAAVGILHVSFEGRILRCNQRFADFLGYSPEEIAGNSFQQFTPPEHLSESEGILQELGAGAIGEKGFEKPYLRKDGSILWARLNTSVQRDGKGQPLHLVTFVEDITDRKSAEEHLAAASLELQASEVRHRTVFQTSQDALNISRLSDGKIVDANKTFLDLTGFQREEVIGRTTAELGIWTNPSERQDMIDELRHNSSIRDEEMLFSRKDGSTFWGLTSASVIEFEGIPHVLVASRNISDAKEAVKMIRDLAFYDPVTHLPNRRSLLDLLEQTHDADPRERALLFVDLDKFKALNDALGHRAGDLLLQQAAQRLAACVRGEGTVARLSGDEFAIVLNNLGNTPEGSFAHVEQIGERILATGALPFPLGEREWHCSLSIGITMFGTDLRNGLEALQQGEIAVSKAKEAGGNAIRFFSPELQANVNARVLMETELRKAIKAEEFELYFQPQVRESRLIGSEALVRWNHPERGILAPGAFIPLAEETGLILPLGDWVLRETCEHIAGWVGKNQLANVPVAVNISTKQFSQPDIVASVLNILDLTGANPANLELELTETLLVKDFRDTISKMTELKSHGLKFSIDDFGTGYSSLAYLKSLPLDRLKIDRTFVKDILVDGPSGAIAQAIISLGHSMGLSVIAEGVETEEQRDFLLRLGCDSFQGFLFSRPLPADEFERNWLH